MSVNAQRQQENEPARTFFSKRLELAMTLRGESALSLGEKVGKAHSTVGRWLRGSEPKGAALIEKIARALSVSAQWLLTGEGKAPAGIVREQDGDYGKKTAIEEEVLAVIRGGEAGAAKTMDDQELMKRIKEHAGDLQRCAPYMRGGQAKIIAAFALELYSRSTLKQLEDKK